MRLYDVEQVAQKDLVDSGQEEDEVVFDNTPFLKNSKTMRNSLTSRFKKTYKVKYYHDIHIETKKWEVIELPSRSVIKTFDFEDDAIENTSFEFYHNKPFGDTDFQNS